MQLTSFFRQLSIRALMVLVLAVSATTLIWAEGSKDFVGYPGTRMFLDTRDPQQMKVFANEDEFINLGASHLGFPEGVGYIRVYRPDGTLHTTFTNPFPLSSKVGMIESLTQELAGPTGGGTGYVPAVVQVPTGQAGVWTVVFGYTTTNALSANFTNIANNFPWTPANQAQAYKRAILAWDITITEGVAGNQPNAIMHEGRVYSNEYITLIRGNGHLTSPTFYVLTNDGYLYQVDVKDADPFRFPISSNSLGLVDGLGQPAYKSKLESAFQRSHQPGTWSPSNLYLFEPQAADYLSPPFRLINNKIFFNIPDSNMPSSALVSDVFYNHPPTPSGPPYPPTIPPSPPVSHTTWLNTPIQDFSLVAPIIFIGVNANGLNCSPGSIQFGKGGFFVFNTNIGGSVTLELDLNNNGYSESDPMDTVLQGVLNPGLDSIYWNGWLNGAAVPVNPAFQFGVTGNIQYGQVHIALTDVEGNIGGVTFKRLTPIPNQPDDLFYFDHSDIFPNDPAAISGNGTPGHPKETNIPYVYDFNEGNEKYIDEWTFVEYPIDTTFIVKIDSSCVCDTINTPVLTGTGGGVFCEGQELTMTATNSVLGTGDLTYTWSGPPSFNFVETIDSTATSTATIGAATTTNTGTFQVIATTSPAGCADTLTYNVTVNPNPVALIITGGGTYCAGEPVTLEVQTISGFTTLDYAWSGPGVPANMATGTVAGGGIVTLVLQNVQVADAGSYSLVLTSVEGCVSAPISTTITVNVTPVVSSITGNNSYCEGDDVTLTATNSATGFSTMSCTWTGPNGFNVSQNVNGTDPITLNLNNINNSFEGIYTLVCAVGTCASDSVEFDLVVNTPPLISAISPNGSFCEGTSVTFTAQNANLGSGPVTYTWTGPNASLPFTGPALLSGPYDFTIPNLTPADAGIYTLTLGGCPSAPQSVTISVLPAPNLTVTGGGDVCVGQDVTLTATNSTLGVGPIIFIWTDPNGNILSQGITPAATPSTVTINNVTAANSGTYTIFETIDANSCTATATVSLNVLPGLNLIAPTPDSTYCEFNSVVLTATNTVDAGDLTYTWSGPNGIVLGPFTVGSFEPLTAIISEANLMHGGTWTLDVNSTSGCSSSIQVEVTVLAGVRITAVMGGGSYCFDAPVTLNGSGEGSADSVSYTWTDPNGTVIGAGTTVPAGPFPGSSSSNLPGIYVLEVVADSSGCSDSETVTVEIIPLPEVMVLNNDTTLCGLDTLEICGQATTINIGSFSYIWSTPTGEIITGSASGNAPFCDIILPMQDYGAGPYILRISADGCTSEPDTFNVSLNPNPVISIVSGGGTYCAGETADVCFTNTNPDVVGFFYTCILPNGTQVTGQTSTNETICLPVTQSGIICCSLESFDGCVSSQACVTVTFEPSADLSVTANTPVCANETLMLSGTNSLPCSGTITYAWNGPNGFTFVGTAPCAGPFPAVVPNPVSGEYCLIAPLNSNCPDTACITVTVNPVPIVVNNSITGGGTFCAGEEVVLIAQVSISDNSNITYTWCQNNVPIPGQTGTVASGSTITLDLGQVATNEGGEYCLKLESTNGCVNIPPTCIQVTVNPSPAIQTVTGGGTYCEGVDVSLNGTGIPGLGNVTYTWTDPNGNPVFSGTAPSQGPFPATVNDISQLGAGIYTLIVELGDCADTANVIVEVNPKPIITVISGNETVCAGSNVVVSFEVDPNGASSVDWNYDSPEFDTSGTVTTATTITFTIVANSTTSATITAESSDGCEAEPQQINITVQEIDPPVLTPSSLVVCVGDDLVLATTLYTGTVSYEWFKDGVSIGTTNDPNFVVTPPMSGVYTVEVTVDGCSAASSGVAVTVPAVPDAIDDEFTSNTYTTINGNVTDNDVAPDEVIVTLVSSTSGTLDLNEDGTFTYSPSNDPVDCDDSFTYEICSIDCPESCDQATVTISYILEGIVPNVLTPDGDGINDILVITCIPTKTGDPSPTRMRIFNRWGDEVASFEPYYNEEGWDGTYGSDKKAVPAATYFYLFEADKDSGNKPKAGYIKVVR